jgi:hypothetical protein
MKRIINNEGKLVNVTDAMYSKLADMFKSGIWCTIIRDINGSVHSIIIPDNFK